MDSASVLYIFVTYGKQHILDKSSSRHLFLRASFHDVSPILCHDYFTDVRRPVTVTCSVPHGCRDAASTQYMPHLMFLHARRVAEPSVIRRCPSFFDYRPLSFTLTMASEETHIELWFFSKRTISIQLMFIGIGMRRCWISKARWSANLKNHIRTLKEDQSRRPFVFGCAVGT